MGAKPRKMGAAARVPAVQKPAPARRVPARKATGRLSRAGAVRPKTVEAYVAAMGAELAAAGERLRRLVLSAAPSATESIKWGQPVYEDAGPFCYFKAAADHITFGFWRGAELDDPDHRLEGEGDRMRHIKIRSSDDLVDDVVADWVRQAVLLNRRLGNPTRQMSATRHLDAVVDDLDEGGAVHEVEPGQIESVQPIETANHDGEPFATSWDEGDR